MTESRGRDLGHDFGRTPMGHDQVVARRQTEPFKKVVRVGSVPSYGDRRMDVFCTIDWDGDRLSFTGVEGPKTNGDAHGGCGQIDMHYRHRNPADDDPRYTHLVAADEFRFAPGWDADRWLDLLDCWKEWHLSDANAECDHQRELGWTYATHRGQECPVCGYEIGTEWKRRDVPGDVLDFLRSLPDTDKQPAWA